jgi:hypothetical protein
MRRTPSLDQIIETIDREGRPALCHEHERRMRVVLAQGAQSPKLFALHTSLALSPCRNLLGRFDQLGNLIWRQVSTRSRSSAVRPAAPGSTAAPRSICIPAARPAAPGNARLGADVVRYFIVSDFHRLLLAGLPAHFESYQPCSRSPGCVEMLSGRRIEHQPAYQEASILTFTFTFTFTFTATVK